MTQGSRHLARTIREFDDSDCGAAPSAVSATFKGLKGDKYLVVDDGGTDILADISLDNEILQDDKVVVIVFKNLTMLVGRL